MPLSAEYVMNYFYAYHKMINNEITIQLFFFAQYIGVYNLKLGSTYFDFLGYGVYNDM